MQRATGQFVFAGTTEGNTDSEERLQKGDCRCASSSVHFGGCLLPRAPSVFFWFPIQFLSNRRNAYKIALTGDAGSCAISGSSHGSPDGSIPHTATGSPHEDQMTHTVADISTSAQDKAVVNHSRVGWPTQRRPVQGMIISLRRSA